jgi:hypothetical protein
MRKSPDGASLIAELDSALTLLDNAKVNFVPEKTASHIEEARVTLAQVETRLATAVLSDSEQTEIVLWLRELHRRLD